MNKILLLSLFFAFLLPGPNSHSQLSAILLPRLDDFKVNDDGSGYWQSNPNTAVGGNGNFIVVWDDNRIGYNNVYCQIYNYNGTAIGGNIKVNENHNLHHQFPSVAVDSLGNFIVTWLDARSGKTHIYGQVCQSNGSKTGNNFKVSSDLDQLSAGDVQVAMNKRGEFIVVWENVYQNAKDIFGQRYTSSGVPTGGNFKINDNSTLLHIFPDAAMDNIGNIVVVWEEQRSGQYDIYGQRYNPYGNPVSGNFKINDETNFTNQTHPAIDMDEAGNFIVIWNDWRDGGLNIYGQRFTQNGDEIDSNFRINDPAVPCDVTFPDVAVDDQGYFVAAWSHPVKGIYGQLFDPSGNLLGNNFQIDSGGENTRQLYPKVALYNNQLYAAWRDNRLESQWDIFANILTEQMPQQVQAPVFDPLPGTFTSSVAVSMHCSTDGAVIHYTTDGSTPSETSAIFTGSVPITATVTIKAKAYKDGLFPSDVQSGMYTIEPDPVESYDGLTVVHLHQGWNCFSFDVQPADPQISEILKGIEGKFDWITGYENGIEVTYHPDSAGTNTLYTLNPLHGYYIHMLKPAVLSISGTEISSSTPIPLSQGVHLISYLPDDALMVQEALQSIWDHVALVKTIDPSGMANGQGADGGISFDPALLDYNTLVTMQNGFGYEIQVDDNVTLVYPEAPAGTVLASATIGPEGGTLAVSEFIMTIPQGAFASFFHLTLTQFTDNLSYSDDVNSASFTVTGMPEDFAIAIRLAIKYNDTLSEQSFIAAGERTYIPEINDYETIPFMYEATDSLGYCVTWLPAGESGEPDYWTGPPSAVLHKNTKSNMGLTVYNVLKGYRSYQSKYFTFAYSFLSAYSSDIPTMAAYFDNVVQTGIGGIGLGFNFAQLDLLKSKLIHVVVERDISKVDYLLKTKPYKPPLVVEVLENFDRCEMHINEKALDGDHDLLKQKVGILVFGLRQWMAFNDQKYWSWLNYAYQMWVGQRFTNLPDFFNPYDLSPFQERYLIPRPFLGLEAGGVIPEGLTTDPEMAIMLKKVHGYGMVSFIKYIETERKIAEVKKLWNTFNPRSPMAAIFSAFDKSESSWWPDYSAKYVQGDIYNITDKTMLNTIHKDNVFTISKDTDTLKCFDDRYQDLSSALYRVDLKYDQIDSLVFTLGPPGLNLDYVTFHIFKLRNEMFEYVGQGIQGDEYIELVVKKIPDLMSAGYHSLVALVVNSANESPYTGTLDIEFEVSSRQKVHRECRMTFWNFKYDDSFEDPSHNISTRTNQPLQYKMYDSVTGELRDNVYTASWQNKHDLWSPNSSSGNMRIDFNFNNQIITKFYFKVISEQKGITKKELTIEAVDIPYQGEDPIIKGWDWYKIVGEAIKTDHITQLTFVHTDYNFAGEWISTLTDFHTQDNSYIYIYMQ